MDRRRCRRNLTKVGTTHPSLCQVLVPINIRSIYAYVVQYGPGIACDMWVKRRFRDADGRTEYSVHTDISETNPIYVCRTLVRSNTTSICPLRELSNMQAMATAGSLLGQQAVWRNHSRRARQGGFPKLATPYYLYGITPTHLEIRSAITTSWYLDEPGRGTMYLHVCTFASYT